MYPAAGLGQEESAYIERAVQNRSCETEMTGVRDAPWKISRLSGKKKKCLPAKPGPAISWPGAGERNDQIMYTLDVRVGFWIKETSP